MAQKEREARRSMKCLVTGCAGFIGSTLAERLLLEGYQVKGIDIFTDYYSRALKERNLSPLLKNKKFTFLEEDILKTDPIELLKNIDIVFHQSAQAGVRASWGDDFIVYTDNNIRATQILLEAAKEVNLQRFIYASSSSVYGEREDLPMREEDPLYPSSPYGVTKLAAENLCYLYYLNYGIPTISLRYFTVYGPKQRPDMAFHRFGRAILKREEITIFGDGRQSRDFTYIDDAVEANLLAAKSSAQGEVFNIGGGSQVLLIEAIEILEELAGEKALLKNVEVQKGDVRHTRALTKRARDILGFQPKISIREGLREELQWLREVYL